jgi:hypothetical protein
MVNRVGLEGDISASARRLQLFSPWKSVQPEALPMDHHCFEWQYVLEHHRAKSQSSASPIKEASRFKFDVDLCDFAR